MTGRGQSDAEITPELSVLVAFGCLNVSRGTGTRTSRVVMAAFPKGLTAGGPAGWFARVFDGLETPFRDRAALRAVAEGEARAALVATRERGLRLIEVFSSEYPAWLRHIPDPPLVLWVRGEAPLSAEQAACVAVVGSRNATPAGLAIAQTLGFDLARAGLTVVSGLARGIDGAAHRGALRARGRTLAVLGCGADVVYPKQHVDLAAEIAAAGWLASEYPPGTPPLPMHFPLRNRIISGLSRAVVVVEASEKSGSLITARAALDQGRDVLAVPGPVAAGCYRGCHALIKDGARLVETVEDVFQELSWRRATGPPEGLVGKSNKMSDLEDMMPVGSPLSVEGLVQASGWPVSEVLSQLSRLEVAGRVAQAGAGMFVKLDGLA